MGIQTVALIAWTVWMVIARGVASDIDDLGYTLEKYKESPGIYYENIGQANFYNTNWRTIVYVNLKQTVNQ